MKKFDHSLLILRKNFENSDRSMYAICVGWVNFVHSLRCSLKNLRSQKFYATAGRTGRDKYHLWIYSKIVYLNNYLFQTFLHFF